MAEDNFIYSLELIADGNAEVRREKIQPPGAEELQQAISKEARHSGIEKVQVPPKGWWFGLNASRCLGLSFLSVHLIYLVQIQSLDSNARDLFSMKPFRHMKYLEKNCWQPQSQFSFQLLCM